VEACRAIDVNRLHREGCLLAGWYLEAEAEWKKAQRAISN
jgi:hypothetical protein